MKKYIVPQVNFPCRLTPEISMLGNYYFNLFLIKGHRKTALFETGVSSVVDRVINQINQLNVPLDYIIPAHPHSDHITGLPGLMDAFPEADVLISEDARSFIEHPKAGPALISEDLFVHDRLPDHGVFPGRPPLKAPPDLSNTSRLDHHTVLDLGGITMELHLVGGHAPGNIIAHLPEANTVLSSDSLGFHFPGRMFFPLFFTGLNEYMHTLDFIRHLSPDLICPAHQLPIQKEKIHDAFTEIDHTIHTLKTRVMGHTGDESRLIEDLFRETYRDEFTLYSPDNIRNCIRLLIRRVREAA